MNHEELHRQIEKFAEIATRGCGQSDIVWGALFQSKFDGWVERLSVEDTEAAIAIAKKQDYYCEENPDDEELGSEYCCHGLTSDSCPCGCFEDSPWEEKRQWLEFCEAEEAAFYAEMGQASEIQVMG